MSAVMLEMIHAYTRLSKRSCGQEKMQASNSSGSKTRESIATVGQVGAASPTVLCLKTGRTYHMGPPPPQMGGGGGGGGGGEYVVGYGGGGVEYVDPNLVIQKARGIQSSAKLKLQSLEWTSDVPNVTIDEILQDFLSLENGGGGMTPQSGGKNSKNITVWVLDVLGNEWPIHTSTDDDVIGLRNKIMKYAWMEDAQASWAIHGASQPILRRKALDKWTGKFVTITLEDGDGFEHIPTGSFIEDGTIIEPVYDDEAYVTAALPSLSISAFSQSLKSLLRATPVEGAF